jgi:hypothetical protein
VSLLISMFIKRKTATTTALFTIALASSLIAASGLAGFAFAAVNKGKDDITDVSQKDLKGFIKCVSGAAVEHDLNLAKLKNCYSQVFGNGLGQGTDQSRSIEGNTVLPTMEK